MELVKLGSYLSRTEAELIRARLEANGIESMVQADDAAGWAPQLEITQGVQVLVRDTDLAAAYDVLERMLPAGEDPES